MEEISCQLPRWRYRIEAAKCFVCCCQPAIAHAVSQKNGRNCVSWKYLLRSATPVMCGAIHMDSLVLAQTFPMHFPGAFRSSACDSLLFFHARFHWEGICFALGECQAHERYSLMDSLRFTARWLHFGTAFVQCEAVLPKRDNDSPPFLRSS